MKKIGKVINVTRERLITVVCEDDVRIGESLFDSKNGLIGRVVRVFGSVQKHYLSVKPASQKIRIISILDEDVYKR